MQGLQQFIAFADTAKHGSFAAAAREHGVSPSALAKAVSRLETSLGVKLFHRTTRQVTLTGDGERLFHRCQRVLAEVDDLEAEAAGTRAAPTGVLRIDAPIVYGRRVLLPVLVRLVEQHPGLQLDLRLQDAYVDLVKDGIDMAIRVGALGDSGLVARRFASMSLLLVASPAYVHRHGAPRTLDQLSSHRAVVFRQPTSGRQRPWQFRTRGQPVELHPPSRVIIDDGEAMAAAAAAGVGVAQLPDNMVDQQIQRGELVELLPGHRPPPMPVSAVYPSGRLVPPRVRAVLEALEQLC